MHIHSSFSHIKILTDYTWVVLDDRTLGDIYFYSDFLNSFPCVCYLYKKKKAISKKKKIKKEENKEEGEGETLGMAFKFRPE